MVQNGIRKCRKRFAKAIFHEFGLKTTQIPSKIPNPIWDHLGPSGFWMGLRVRVIECTYFTLVRAIRLIECAFFTQVRAIRLP